MLTKTLIIPMSLSCRVRNNLLRMWEKDIIRVTEGKKELIVVLRCK